MPDKKEVFSKVLYSFAPVEFITRLQKGYLKYFEENKSKKVLDIGCGRGIFLDLLSEAGMNAYGIDGSEEAIKNCKAKGHNNTECGDIFPYLEKKAEEKENFDGIFCSHLIEHLPSDLAVELICLCNRLLSPGGRLILVTPNPSNLEVLTEIFWLDPTHVRPYPRNLLTAMLEAANFETIESFADRRTRRKYSFKEMFYRLPGDFFRYGLNNFTGMDSVIIAQKI